MKRKKLWILSVIILAAILIYGIFVTRIFTKSIEVERPSLMVTNQVSKIENLVKWLYPFSGKDSAGFVFSDYKVNSGQDTLEITSANWQKTMLKLHSNGQTQKLLLTLHPDMGSKFKLDLSYESTWAQYILGTNKLAKSCVKSFEQFNEYLNDSKKVYGYQIEMVPVTDTTFLFSQSIVPNAGKTTAVKNQFEALIKHAADVQAGYNGIRIFYTTLAGSDSVSVNTAIAVTNSSIEDKHVNGPYIFKRMPYQKNLLAAFYQGRFDGIDRVYKALEKFKVDYNLKSMAIPFAKLMTEGTSFTNEQVVQAVVYYPVY